MSERETSDAAARRLAALLGPYHRGKIGRGPVLAWLDDDRNLRALGQGGLGSPPWFAEEVRKRLAGPGSWLSDDDARPALDALVLEYRRRDDPTARGCRRRAGLALRAGRAPRAPG
jgi:hypothetical protein